MKHKIRGKTQRVREAVEKLPYFSIDDLVVINSDREHLKKIIYRLSYQKEIVSLKRGLYVSQKYLDKTQRGSDFSFYIEFVGSVIHGLCYLSAEYILDKHGILSESVSSMTFVTRKKTNKFSNKLGFFKYYHIKEKLFTGFEIVKKGDFSVVRATLPKALFDFLYFRKLVLFDEEQIRQLRLNLEDLSVVDFKRLRRYIRLEGSKRMKNIFNFLVKKYAGNNSGVEKFD